jgi:hypothetical protein
MTENKLTTKMNNYAVRNRVLGDQKKKESLRQQGKFMEPVIVKVKSVQFSFKTKSGYAVIREVEQVQRKKIINFCVLPLQNVPLVF